MDSPPHLSYIHIVHIVLVHSPHSVGFSLLMGSLDRCDAPPTAHFDHGADSHHQQRSNHEEGTPSSLLSFFVAHLERMFAPTAFRLASRRVATHTSRRAFSATTSSTAKTSDNARKTFMVAAAALSVLAVVQQREVSRASLRYRCTLLSHLTPMIHPLVRTQHRKTRPKICLGAKRLPRRSRKSSGPTGPATL